MIKKTVLTIYALQNKSKITINYNFHSLEVVDRVNVYCSFKETAVWAANATLHVNEIHLLLVAVA